MKIEMQQLNAEKYKMAVDDMQETEQEEAAETSAEEEAEFEETIKAAFATTFSFYLKAHNFHWNVEDKDFFEYHNLFGAIYEEVYDSIDDFAEKIRACQIKVPASPSAFDLLSAIDDENSFPSKDVMVDTLLADNDTVLKILGFAYDEAEELGYHGFSNFLAERLDAHNKHGWMLRSSKG